MGDEYKFRKVKDDDDMSSVTWGKFDQHIRASVIFGVDITEVYSPVRVNAVAVKF